MGVVVHGCRVYYNELLEPLGIPLVGECTVSGSVTDRGEHVAREAWSLLRELVGVAGEARYTGSEVIGKRFTVNRYTLTINGGSEGELRVVTRGDLLLNVSMVLSGAASPPGVGRGWRVEEGYNMDSVMLKPGDGGEWPSGQKAIPRFVVYALEGVRDVDASRWRLVVRGRRGTVTLAYKDLADSSSSLGVETFHCVTGWSVKGVEWGGIRLGEILSRVDSMDGGWVVFKSIGGYTTVVPLPYASEGVIVTSINGRPLEARHGFPARFLNPRLYGWKSAKWLAEVEVRDEYVDGVWEALAYHERGLVAAEERFKIRNPEALEILD